MAHCLQTASVLVLMLTLNTLQDKSRRQTYGFLQKISLARLPSLRSDKKLRLPWQHDGMSCTMLFFSYFPPEFLLFHTNLSLVCVFPSEWCRPQFF